MKELLQPFPMPLIAILRGLSPAEAPQVGRVLFDAGFRMLEVPLNRPGAIEAMRALLQIAPPDAVIGAGTVLGVEDVEAVRAAGGRLIVSPHCAEDVIAHASRLGMLTLPGVTTPTEAFLALRAGAHGLKIFPAEMVPPSAFKAIKSILPPSVPMFPVGGITPQNMAEYAASGADGFGIGGQLYKPGCSETTLRDNAQAFMKERQHLLRTAR
ncbi:2-dehydro-3-deoxy-6-phosphogalactonate aldolase [Noviherbaspirillum aridicola]|uniref:2-dehydro-3-deoxy-6-phosphogalactonate aldolase n=1 Tax=Noviherbaspirillum aridicola TaxID=2849687 RepID=A0ABQ4Q2H3_9BURK|nr:2-dehydro-3-deoxy-6-phosphogalactonate aldolase [Noviherbaspirillum aridicola]GIZ51231.1 2-dehydro-3-deoxy-6-phosphogalactonate aldolase [Noviherbaspirillum aridicola]